MMVSVTLREEPQMRGDGCYRREIAVGDGNHPDSYPA